VAPRHRQHTPRPKPTHPTPSTLNPKSYTNTPQASEGLLEPVWLYQLTEVIGKPLPRSFPPPRKIEMLYPYNRASVGAVVGRGP